MNKREILRKFGKNVRLERVRQDITQEKLAEMAGLSCFSHIGKIERGEMNPTLTTILAIMNALKIPFENLFNSDT